METPIAVLEGMDEDEAEGRGRCLEHRVEFNLAHVMVRGDEALHQVGQVFKASAYEFRQRIALMIAFAEEDAVRPQTGLREALAAGRFLAPPMKNIHVTDPQINNIHHR